MFVDAKSPLTPNGWIGILGLGDAITACVPRAELQRPVATALADLSVSEATTPDIVIPRLPPTGDVLGPAALFYPPSGYSVDHALVVEDVRGHDLDALFDAVARDELEESGLQHVTETVYGSRAATGQLAAACGYRRWPNDVAHISVLTHPAYRRQGHARHAATGAIRRAIDERLLPQWRARVLPSQALALRLGLVAMGAQLSVRPASET